MHLIEDEVKSGPPLEQHQRKSRLVILDLAPEETQYEGLHPGLIATLQVEALLLLLEVVHLQHYGLDYLVQPSFGQVNLLHRKAGSLVAGSEPDQIHVGVSQADLVADFKNKLLLRWLELAMNEVRVPAPHSIETAFSQAEERVTLTAF